MMTEPVIEIADQDYDCNASEFIKESLSDIVPELSFAQKRDIVRARVNGWKVKKGEPCRRYIWDEGESEEMECVEIPEMADICSDLDLWP